MTIFEEFPPFVVGGSKTRRRGLDRVDLLARSPSLPPLTLSQSSSLPGFLPLKNRSGSPFAYSVAFSIHKGRADRTTNDVVKRSENS